MKEKVVMMLSASEYCLTAARIPSESATATVMISAVNMRMIVLGRRWPKRIMEQIMEYNILDFSEWEDDVKFEGMFSKLIDGLELFYKG